MGYHLLNLAHSNYSIDEVLHQRKEWKQRGEPVACLMNATRLKAVFYVLDPDLLIVDIQSSDPEVYLTDKLLRSSASIIRLSRTHFERLSEVSVLCFFLNLDPLHFVCSDTYNSIPLVSFES